MNLFKKNQTAFQFSVFLTLLLFLFGCVSKPERPVRPEDRVRAVPVYPTPIGPAEPTNPPYATPGDTKPATEATPQQGAPGTVPPVTPGDSTSEPRKIALVLGGAGVASFATVGLLKRFQEEGVPIEFVIATGWPALFTLGYGFTKSIHDLEWFASRLKEKDFNSAGIFKKGDSSVEDRLEGLISSTFKQQSLSESKVPIVISATNTELGDSEVFESGDWKEPLLKTMSVPGLYRPFVASSGHEWTQSLRGLDVEEAERKGAKIIIAVDMYGDYFDSFKNKKEGPEKAFRKYYTTEFRKRLTKEYKQATLRRKIILGKGPSDFSARRAAMIAGYKEASKLIKELHGLAPMN